MFIVNQEILSEKNNKELWDWYQAELKKIRDLKREYFQFNTRRNPILLETNKGKIKSTKNKSLPLTAVYENKQMQEFQTWEYTVSANAISTDRGVAKLKRTNNMNFANETMLSTAKDIEIIFFLMVISNYLDKGILFYIDKEAENKERAERNLLEAEVSYLIASPSSPISPERLGDENVFRQLCIAWGVSDVVSKPIYQLKNELKDAVFTSQNNINQTQRGFKLFIKECNSFGDSELRSEVMLAQERGLLFYDDITWKLKGKGGTEQAVEIMEKKDLPMATDILVRRFSGNSTLKALLQEIIGVEKSTPEILDMTQHELRSALMEEGEPYNELKKMKLAELKELYNEKVLNKV
jgi:hypothetical protein